MPIRTYQEVLRTNLRRLRSERRWTQADLAERARLTGLRWTPSVVASIETGRRELSAAEVFALPGILRASREELHTVRPSEVIDVAGVEVLPNGWPVLVRGETWTTFRPSPAIKRMMEDRVRVRQRLAHRYQLSHAEAYRALGDSLRLAEQSAARRLGLEAEELAMAALALWGRGLTEERERRLAQSAGRGAEQQRRGRITRELLRELREAGKAGPGMREARLPRSKTGGGDTGSAGVRRTMTKGRAARPERRKR